MSTLQSFFDASKAIFALGPKTDIAGRAQIRTLVDRLAEELDRALSLADSYLAGLGYAEDDLELTQSLQGGYGKLTSHFRDHHIQAAMRHLADQFHQVFDPAKFTVPLAPHAELPTLIEHLADGERAVLDDLAAADRKMQELAGRLEVGNGKHSVAVRKDLAKSVEFYRHEIAEHRKKLKAVRRRLIDEL